MRAALPSCAGSVPATLAPDVVDAADETLPAAAADAAVSPAATAVQHNTIACSSNLPLTRICMKHSMQRMFEEMLTGCGSRLPCSSSLSCGRRFIALQSRCAAHVPVSLSLHGVARASAISWFFGLRSPAAAAAVWEAAAPPAAATELEEVLKAAATAACMHDITTKSHPVQDICSHRQAAWHSHPSCTSRSSSLKCSRHSAICAGRSGRRCRCSCRLASGKPAGHGRL